MNVKEKETGIDFSAYLYYDETSPTCLRWKIDVFVGRYLSALKYGKDTPAGCFTKYADGVPAGMRVGVDKNYYSVHRVVWEILKGPIPACMVVDHLNGDPWDNRIDNLECKTQKHNIQNSAMSRNNSSGVTGVSKRKFNETPIWYWQARVHINGKVKTKSFSTNKYGDLEAFNLACSWRLLQIKILNEQGENYTERHGK